METILFSHYRADLPESFPGKPLRLLTWSVTVVLI